MAAHIFRKLADKYRQFGWRNLLSRVWKSVASKAGWVDETYLYHAIDLDRAGSPGNVPEGYIVKALQAADFEAAAGRASDHIKPALAAERIRSGRFHPYGLFYDGKLVYSFWISFAEVELNSMTPDPSVLSLHDDEGYLVDAHCDPAHRGKGLHTFMTLYLLSRLREMGKKRGIIIIIKENTAALKSTARAGFSQVKRLRHIRLPGWEKFNVADIPGTNR